MIDAEEINEVVQHGTISGLSGHPMSGLWTLHFEEGPPAFIESGYGVRALADCFGATEFSGDLMEKIKGQRIVYVTDFLGVMEWFAPDEGEE